MFLKLYDAKTNVNMLLAADQIISVKEYVVSDNRERIPNVKSVVMTRPVGDANKTHDYFVSESIDEIEEALNLIYTNNPY